MASGQFGPWRRSSAIRSCLRLGAGLVGRLAERVGFIADIHRSHHDTFIRECRKIMNGIDPDYEDFDKMTKSVWQKDLKKSKGCLEVKAGGVVG